MGATRVVVGGQLRPDGTLQLDEKLALPAGRVEVTVQVADCGAMRDDTWTVLERIWSEQRDRGGLTRSREEIDAGIVATRDECEARMRQFEQIHQQSRQRRE